MPYLLSRANISEAFVVTLWRRNFFYGIIDVALLVSRKENHFFLQMQQQCNLLPRRQYAAPENGIQNFLKIQWRKSTSSSQCLAISFCMPRNIIKHFRMPVWRSVKLELEVCITANMSEHGKQRLLTTLFDRSELSSQSIYEAQFTSMRRFFVRIVYKLCAFYGHVGDKANIIRCAFTHRFISCDGRVTTPTAFYSLRLGSSISSLSRTFITWKYTVIKFFYSIDTLIIFKPRNRS